MFDRALFDLMDRANPTLDGPVGLDRGIGDRPKGSSLSQVMCF